MTAPTVASPASAAGSARPAAARANTERTSPRVPAPAAVADTANNVNDAGATNIADLAAVTRTRTSRKAPQVVESGLRTADVLHFHRPTQAPAPRPGGRLRTAGSSALAPEPGERPARRLHAVPSPREAEEVRKLAAAITRAAMEVLAGTRPVMQLAPWLHRDLLPPIQLRADLRRAAMAGKRAVSGNDAPRIALLHRSAAVKAVHATLVQPGVYEAAVVVSDAARCRAVALRLEAAGPSWQVTALEVG
ncbi:Rv3235 family protein [Sinomonas sp. ASV486]|uniref:Rv3235 family protein n=1 Tax=Sinomonas sp. ASV486 TaxID=3051170 RepID=UPI0027DD57CC|nr:Rv3235 family protein [Sinomonas sp. ASV486]MDQ4490999.1 Rv3235 family protein [Sinomonas sp. ASV486]